MNKADRHKFVFLCGLHRSGTSPLFQILREHPDVSGFRDTSVPEDEGQFLQTVFPPAKAFGGAGRFGFAPEAHLTEESGLITAENKERLFGEWSRYWDLSKPFLLEKSPPNLIKTRFLQALFPDSYFIVLTRHPIAVSLATQKWAGVGLQALLEHWLHCHRLFELDRPHLRHVRVIRYEELIHATESELKQIYGFLGVRPQSGPALDPAGNDRYFMDWRELSDNGKGRELFGDIIAKYEEQVKTFGYSFLDCSTTFAPSDRMLRT
jgi:hypothetical protein